eukprot:610021-Pelagomonas_calceolata.AAC.3
MKGIQVQGKPSGVLGHRRFTGNEMAPNESRREKLTLTFEWGCLNYRFGITLMGFLWASVSECPNEIATQEMEEEEEALAERAGGWRGMGWQAVDTLRAHAYPSACSGFLPFIAYLLPLDNQQQTTHQRLPHSHTRAGGAGPAPHRISKLTYLHLSIHATTPTLYT